MKTLLLSLQLLFISTLFAQNTTNLVLFTDAGEPFYAYVNSVQQNDVASANVKISNINTEQVRVRIVFEDKNLLEFTKNVYLQFGYEITAMIKRNNKGEFVIRPISEPVAIDQAPSRGDSQPIIVYHSEPAANNSRPVAVNSVQSSPNSMEVTETVVVTSNSSNSLPANNEAINMNVNMPGVNMQLNVTDGLVTDSENMNITTTTTTTTTTSNYNSSVQTPVDRQPTNAYNYQEEIIEEPLVPGYSGPIGCNSYLMSDSQVKSAKASIEKQSFEDTKLTTARQIISNYCVTSAQVKEIMEVFTFEDSKLTFAKESYERTYDIGNYWMINDGFTFSSSIDELNEYINSKR